MFGVLVVRCFPVVEVEIARRRVSRAEEHDYVHLSLPCVRFTNAYCRSSAHVTYLLTRMPMFVERTPDGKTRMKLCGWRPNAEVPFHVPPDTIREVAPNPFATLEVVYYYNTSLFRNPSLHPVSR